MQKNNYTSMYFLFLIIFLMCNEFFDTYTTLFWPTISSYVIDDLFLGDQSLYSFFIAIASIGTYFVFFNQVLADKLGRKPMIFVVLFGMGFTSFLLNFCQTSIEFTLYLFLLFIWFSSDIWAIVIAEESEKHRGKIINLILIVGAVATLIIPILRSAFVENYGWRAMTWFGVLAIPTAFLTLFMKETQAFERLKEKNTEKHTNTHSSTLERTSSKDLIKPFLEKESKHYFLVIMGLGFVLGVNYIFLSLGETYLMIDREYDPDFVSTVIFLMGIAAITCYAITGAMLDYIGRKNTSIIFIILLPAGVILVLIESTISVIIGAMIVSGSFWALNVSTRIICLEHFPTERRGTGNGWRNLFYAVGITFGHVIAAVLIPFIGLGATFLLISLSLVPCISFIHKFLKETKGRNLISKLD
ncbi:MAG: MFS transporter [Candidatus Hodarchaeota archaeon]